MRGLGLLPRIIDQGGGSVNLVRTTNDLDLVLLSTMSFQLNSNVALRLVLSLLSPFNTTTTVTRRSRLEQRPFSFLFAFRLLPSLLFVRLQVLSPTTPTAFFYRFTFLSILYPLSSFSLSLPVYFSSPVLSSFAFLSS